MQLANFVARSHEMSLYLQKRQASILRRYVIGMAELLMRGLIEIANGIVNWAEDGIN